MTIPIPGKPGLDELRRAGLATAGGAWPPHWTKAGCYCVSVEVAGVPYIMVNENPHHNVAFEGVAPDDDPAATHWKFFRSVEECDEFVKVEAVKIRVSE